MKWGCTKSGGLRLCTDRSETETRYMLFEELMKEEYNAGKEEGREEASKSILIDLLCVIEPISDNLRSRILSIEDIEAVMKLTVKAAKSDSIELFEKELSKMGY